MDIVEMENTPIADTPHKVDVRIYTIASMPWPCTSHWNLVKSSYGI